MTSVSIRVAGIPAIANVLHYERCDGSYSFTADSDIDYYGYTELEYEICDRRGRPAPWLQRKVKTDADERDIREQILEQLH